MQAVQPVVRLESALGDPDADRAVWKLVHVEGMRRMLWDLATDPDEFHDRGADPACEPERARLMAEIDSWARRHHTRVTITDAEIEARAGREFYRGILIGFWDEAEVAEAHATGVGGDN